MIDIINTAAQYGIIPCIMLVVLYLIDKHNKNKANERDKELDIEKETSLISSIESIIKAARDVEHTPEDEDSKTRLNNYIANQLGCLIEKGANRAYLFSYHNGAKDLLGKGYTKMSIILEQVDMTCQSIMKEFKTDLGSTRTIKTTDLYMYRNTTTPGVLVECGYLSNPTERTLLQQENYQKKLAKSITNGIINYLKKEGQIKYVI